MRMAESRPGADGSRIILKANIPQKLLLVRKTTNLEWHGDAIRREVSAGRMPAEDLARLQRAHDEHYQTLDGLRSRLIARQLPFIEITRDTDWPAAESFGVVVTVGGDGTLLSASHKVLDDTVVVGIRSSRSSVGYLCAYGGDDLDSVVENLTSGGLKSQRVQRMMARIRRVGTPDDLTTEPVLNDFLYSNVNPAATTRYRLRLGTQVELQKSSGIWISTAVGSSAGIAGAGGQRLDWRDLRCQFRVREVFAGGKFVPGLTGGLFELTGGLFEIENRSERAFLALDGQHGEVPLFLGDKVLFCQAPQLNLAVAPGSR